MTDSSKYSFYVQDEEEEIPASKAPPPPPPPKERFNYTAPKAIIEEAQKETGAEEDAFRKPKLTTYEDKYTQRKKVKVLSPQRTDVFTEG